jgi:hypothetical protein
VRDRDQHGKPLPDPSAASRAESGALVFAANESIWDGDAYSGKKEGLSSKRGRRRKKMRKRRRKG